MPSVDGLISGLKTTDIVSQLMRLEKQPQVRLQTRQATVQSAIGSLRALNTQFLAVTTAAAKLTDPSGWALATASSSDSTKVAVTAAPGAAQGTLSLKVSQLAAAGSYLHHTVVGQPAVGSTSAVVATPETIIFLKKGDGDAVPIATGDGSLAAVTRAINASGAGVTATAVQLTAGHYSLKLESTTTGLDTTIRVGTTDGADDAFTAAFGAQQTLAQPRNAELLIGTTSVSRAGNTISDLLPGVTLSLLKADATATDPPTVVGVKGDAEKVAGQVAALVDAVNAVSNDIKAVTGYNLDTKNKGKLYGDAGIRSLRDRLIGAVTGPGTAGAGVSIDRNGVVSFDRATFLKAFGDDPATVQRVLGVGTPEVATTATTPLVPAVPGLAGRLHAVADGASRSATAARPGLIATAISNRETQVRTLTSDIADWDRRLEVREASLKRTYAGLEKALGASQSQGQWLASQIAGLPRWS